MSKYIKYLSLSSYHFKRKFVNEKKKIYHSNLTSRERKSNDDDSCIVITCSLYTHQSNASPPRYVEERLVTAQFFFYTIRSDIISSTQRISSSIENNDEVTKGTNRNENKVSMNCLHAVILPIHKIIDVFF